MVESKSAQQVREITDKLEQGIKELFDSERFKEYLRTMSKFYHYSFSNTLLIAMQKPEATYVAGYTAWQRNFDRQVMKGEKGIKILAPAPYKAKEEREMIDPSTQKPVLDADGKPVTETVEVMHSAFKVVSVFDISQTDGKELPDIIVDELSGSVENYAAFFEALKQESPVPITFENIPGGAKGYFSPIENRVAIQEGMSEIQTIKTAIHEIAHAKLHSIDRPEPEPTWKIVMISDGGTKQDFLSGFASETEANEAAEREGWRFVDENRFEWRLEVEEDTSAVQEMRKDRHTKTKSSMRTLPLVPFMRERLLALREEQKENRRLCGRSYIKEYIGYVCVNEIGDLIKPHYVTESFPKLLKANGLRHIRYHDLRHPYVKPTTKNKYLQKQKSQATNEMIAWDYCFYCCSIQAAHEGQKPCSAITAFTNSPHRSHTTISFSNPQ